MNTNIDYTLIFKALSDPIRIDILKKLSTSDSVCVCELIESFNLSQSKLSYHLKSLLSANLITRIPQGKWNFYSVNRNLLEEVITIETINSLFL